MVTNLARLNIKIFGDGADLAAIKALYSNSLIKGFTTNPTLMRVAGINDYRAFALELLKTVPDRPVSFEVFADEFSETASWSPSGDLIAYATGEPDAPQIRVFDLVTGDVTDLGPGHSPAWRPLAPDAATLPWEGAVTDNLRIRSEPNTTSDTVGTLPKGTKVRVYGEAEGEEAEPGSGNRIWYSVIGGWVYSAFVER
ncbi:MAG: SH3 domain-containing protein [Chloroflexi bacterium]|nr:SH3 domain-containing protein [Chloroflexota bacterium]